MKFLLRNAIMKEKQFPEIAMLTTRIILSTLNILNTLSIQNIYHEETNKKP